MAARAGQSRFVLVHGGGAEVTAVSKRLGIEAVFDGGVRQTTAEEMDIVDMVLAGKINTQIVRLLRTCGLDAVGLSGPDGGTFTGMAMGPQTRTADVAADRLAAARAAPRQRVPARHLVYLDGPGTGGSTSTRTPCAFALAAHLGASALLFLSDIPGILRDGAASSARFGGREAAGPRGIGSRLRRDDPQGERPPSMRSRRVCRT